MMWNIFQLVEILWLFFEYIFNANTIKIFTNIFPILAGILIQDLYSSLIFVDWNCDSTGASRISFSESSPIESFSPFSIFVVLNVISVSFAKISLSRQKNYLFLQ